MRQFTIIAILPFLVGFAPPFPHIRAPETPLTSGETFKSNGTSSNPDSALERALAARAARAAARHKSLAETLTESQSIQTSESTEQASKPTEQPVKSSDWRDARRSRMDSLAHKAAAADQKRKQEIVEQAIAARNAARLRSSYTGTRWICFGECGK